MSLIESMFKEDWNWYEDGHEVMWSTLPYTVALSVVYFSAVQWSNARVNPTQRSLWIVTACWNSFMSLFSLAMLVNSMPLVYYFPTFSERCNTGIYDNSNEVWWTVVFMLSKPLEFVDTLLLIARGKQVKTLHWTHHIITMHYTWFAAITDTDLAVIFVLMNCFVHFVMYGYYTLVTFSPWFKCLSKAITILQLTQFVAAIAMIVNSRACLDWVHFMVVIDMYSYYLFMFSAMFVARYWSRADRKKIE